MCTNRSSWSTASMTPVNQLSGSDATSLTPQAASSSAMRLLTSDGLSFMACLPLPHSPRAARVAQCAPDGFRPDRQADIAYAKMPQRVDDRIADCGGGADRSALACPLYAERIARRGAREEGGTKDGNVGRPRQAVIEKARGQELPGGAVVDDMFRKRLADALRQAAVHLSLDNHRVDDHAAVVGGIKIAQLDAAGLRIDDNDGEMHGLRIVGIRRIVEFGDFETRRAVRRQPHPMVGDIGDVGEADRAIGAAHFEQAAAIVDVALRAFERMGGDTLRLDEDLVAGAVNCRSRHRYRARPPGAVAEGDLIRIALEEADIVDREAQAIGRDLTECDLVPLPVRMRPRNHGHLAVTMHAHEGAFPAAVQGAPLREIGARPGAGLVDKGGKPDSHQNSVRA